MGTRTLRPDSTASQTNTTVTGAASRHAALSDNSDASFVTSGSGASECTVTMTDPSPAIPVTAQIRSVQPRLRMDAASVSGVRVTTSPTAGNGVQQTFSSASCTTAFCDITGAALPASPDGDPWTVSEMASLCMRFGGGSGSNANANPGAEAYLDISYNELPVCVVTGPTDDDGTTAGVQVTTASSPTVAWTYSDPEGDVQEAFQVKVWKRPGASWTGFDPDTTTEVPVYDSGTVLGSTTSHTVGVALENTANFRAYVRVADATPTGYARKWSAWSNREFTMALTPPPVPSFVSVSAQSTSNRVQVVVQAGAGSPTTEHFDLQRSDDGGTTWTDVRVSPVTNTGGQVTVYDYEAPREVSVKYRVRGVDTGTGSNISSAWVESSSVTVATDGKSWLKSPSDPSFNISFDHTGSSWTKARRKDIAHHEPEGREEPVTIEGTIRSSAFSLTMKFDYDSEWEAFLALYRRQEPVLFQTCYGHPTPQELWVRFGDIDETLVVTNQSGADVGKQYRQPVTVGCREVRRPD